MESSAKNKIISDFVKVINQIDDRSSDEIESRLQEIVCKIRPHIHRV